MRNRGLFLLILTIFITVTAAVYAETTATVEDCKIKITVNIAITGPGANQDFADRVKQDAENEWNNADIKCGECKCELEVTVNVIVVNDCSDPAASGHHCITVKNTPPGSFHRSTVTAGNWSSPSIPSGTGIWGSGDIGKVITHEIGHLMGLKDEYHDVYFYYYAHPNGSNATNVSSIPVANYTQQKAQEINDSGPPNTTVKFIKNNATGNLTWSRPKSGANSRSLMAGIGADSVPMDSHADNILDMTGLTCPDECCCGDGKIDGNKGEQCDPTTTPSGCDEPKEQCAKNCVCVQVTPRCGDGWVYQPPNYGQPGVGGEECEPSATPTGCDPDEYCTEACECKKNATIEVPSNDSTTIIEPDENDLSDGDGDGIQNDVDNCPQIPNPDQGDMDSDGTGNACDSCDNRDSDGDEIINCLDQCPNEPETLNTYQDEDGCPDIPPPIDTDEDGIPDEIDNCPSMANPDQTDSDGNLVGDACDNQPPDHAVFSGDCFSCHNGITASGKTDIHIPSPDTCEDCHSTDTWTPF